MQDLIASQNSKSFCSRKRKTKLGIFNIILKLNSWLFLNWRKNCIPSHVFVDIWLQKLSYLAARIRNCFCQSLKKSEISIYQPTCSLLLQLKLLLRKNIAFTNITVEESISYTIIFLQLCGCVHKQPFGGVLENCQPNCVGYVVTCQRTLRASLLTFQRALHANMLTCQRVLRAYVLMCQRALRVYVVTCQRALRANVPSVLSCARTNVFYCFHVLLLQIVKKKNQYHVFLRFLVLFLCLSSMKQNYVWKVHGKQECL